MNLSNRLRTFDEILSNGERIDIQKLREIVFDGGCPDDNNYRSLSWKLLLGYLSPHREEWEPTLAEKRKVYQGFVDELILNDQAKQHDDHVIEISSSIKANELFLLASEPSSDQPMERVFQGKRSAVADIQGCPKTLPWYLRNRSISGLELIALLSRHIVFSAKSEQEVFVVFQPRRCTRHYRSQLDDTTKIR